MRPIVFFDPVCYRPYNLHTLKNEPLGGTEATVIRVAERLDAYVLQHNSTSTKGRYLNWTAPLSGIEHVIVLRHPESLFLARARFPKAKLYLWLQDIAGASLVHHMNIVKALGVTIVPVSDWHAGQIRHLLEINGAPIPPIHRVYNPVDDDLAPDSTPVDPNKFVFFSAAHKGLHYTLECFNWLREKLPDAKLYVSNPGYKANCEVNLSGREGLVVLGSLPQPEILKHVRGAQCVFYPNMVFPETFGIVFAESNAVGTPVVTHPIGSAPEVLHPTEQCIDCSNPQAVVERVLSYSRTRPTVSCKPAFRLSSVVSDWNKLLST